MTDRNNRLNLLAACLMEAWDDYIPLTIRYRAAALADDFVAKYFDDSPISPRVVDDVVEVEA